MLLNALGAVIYRERRRLTFVTTMAFLAGFLFYFNADASIHGVHVAFVTGAIYAGVVGTAAFLICLFLPSMRFMIEAVAISRLGLSLFVLMHPALGFQILANPMLTAFLIVFGGAVISRVVHGRFQRDRSDGVFGRLRLFHRAPPTLHAGAWQTRFVTWMDGTAPVRA